MGCEEHTTPVAATPQIEVAVGPRRAGIGRRAQLADQPQLLERRLELRPGHAPLDALERSEGALDRRTLAVGAEVRAQAGTEVAGLADVEHLVVHIVEEVDARPLGSAEREASLAMHAPRPGGGELDEVTDRAGAALLRHADQAQQDLGRRLRVRQCPVARTGVGHEAVRERSEVRRLPAEQASREADGVDHRRRDPPARQPHRLVVEERHVEARVVRDEHSRRPRTRGNAESPAATGGARRSCSSRRPVSAATAGWSRAPGFASVWKRSSSSSPRTRTAPISHGLAVPGRRPVVSRSKTTKVACSSEQRLSGRLGQRDEVAGPAQARVVLHRLVQQRAGEPDGDGASQLQDEAGGLLDRNRAAVLLDELHQAVRGIETQLHRTMPSTNTCSCRGQCAAVRRPPTSVAVTSCSAAMTASAVSGSCPSTQPVSTSSRPP